MSRYEIYVSLSSKTLSEAARKGATPDFTVACAARARAQAQFSQELASLGSLYAIDLHLMLATEDRKGRPTKGVTLVLETPVPDPTITDRVLGFFDTLRELDGEGESYYRYSVDGVVVI
jgi:hypothetical protein